MLADYGQAQLRLDALARRVPVAAPWRARRAAQWDGMTFWSWIRRATHTKLAGELFRLACEAVWACEPEDVSLLHVLFYIHSAGNFDTLIGTDGGAQQDRFAGGSQRLSLVMAEQLGEAVRLGTPVRAIAQDEARRDRRRRAGARGDRRDPAGADRADRVRPAAARAARPARAAHAAGHRRQVHGDLRRAVLARGRAQRPGDLRRAGR